MLAFVIPVAGREIYLLFGSPTAKAVVEKHRVTLVGGELDEVVVIRFERRVPMVPGRSDPMRGHYDGLRLLRNSLRTAEGRRDLIRGIDLRGGTEWAGIIRPRLARGRHGQEILQLVITLPFGRVELQLVPFDVDGDQVIATVGVGRIIGQGEGFEIATAVGRSVGAVLVTGCNAFGPHGEDHGQASKQDGFA